MLVLNRKLNERLVLDCGELGVILVKVCKIERNTVKIGISASMQIKIHREEAKAKSFIGFNDAKSGELNNINISFKNHDEI